MQYREPDPNKKSAKDRWNGLYEGSDFLFGKEPIAFLKHYLPQLMKGEALDVAMGEGRNTVFLAEQGFKTSGLDCSEKAIEKAKALAKEKGVELDAKTQNLDFYLMPLMKFNTVIMTYFRPQARFFTEIRRGLAQGGTFLLEAHTVEHYKAHQGKNPNIEFEDCYKPNEVLQNLKGFHVMYYKEMEEGGNHIVQAIAKKVGV